MSEQQRIYVAYNHIRKKILVRFPAIYTEIIKDEYISKKIVKDRTEFILAAVEEKFKRDSVNIEPAVYDGIFFAVVLMFFICRVRKILLRW